MSASVGVLSQLGIDASSPVTKRFDYRDENLVMREDAIDANGLRGTRSHNVTRCRMGLQRIGGPIRFQPNNVEIKLLLPAILGAAESGGGPYTYALADTLPARYITIDRLGKVFTFTTCKVDTATFRGQQGQPLELDTTWVAVSESVGAAGTFPSLSIDVANGPWIFSDCVITVGGTTVTPRNIEVTVNNHLDKDRYFNSLTLASVESHDRDIMFRCLVPYGDFTALYGSSSSTGLTVVATFTNSSAVLTMTMTKVVLPRMAPNVPGRVELMLPLEGRAYQASDGTRELVVTVA